MAAGHPPRWPIQRASLEAPLGDAARATLVAASVPLIEAGHDVRDVGTDSGEPVDYPAVCAAAGRGVASRRVERVILIEGSGQAEAMAANKVNRVRRDVPGTAEASMAGPPLVPCFWVLPWSLASGFVDTYKATMAIALP